MTQKTEKVKELITGKTIESVIFESWQAPADTMILHFTDKTQIKVMSDPQLCFEGLAFYIPKVKTVTVEEYEEIK